MHLYVHIYENPYISFCDDNVFFVKKNKNIYICIIFYINTLLINE